MNDPSSTLSRRERERRRRRHAMLEAAQAVFAEKGYAGATLDEIAERAEFGKGTLYNYFPDGKEEILFAVFDEIYDRFVALIEKVAEAPGPMRDIYHALVREAFVFFTEREHLFTILVKEGHRLALSDDPKSTHYFMDQRERMTRAFLPALDRAAARGELRDLPLETVGHMLLANLNGMLVSCRLDDRASDGEPSSPPEASEAADFLTTILFDGLQLPTEGAVAAAQPTRSDSSSPSENL